MMASRKCTAAVVLLIALAASSAIAEEEAHTLAETAGKKVKEGPPSLSEWLESQPTVGLAHMLGRHHDSEMMSVCYKSINQCPGFDVPNEPFGFVSDIACCPHKKRVKKTREDLWEDDSDTHPLSPVGQCQLVAGQLKNIRVADSLQWNTDFTATCTLGHKAACGHPFCKDLVLTVNGQWYTVLVATSSAAPAEGGLPETPCCDDNCDNKHTSKAPSVHTVPNLYSKLPELLRDLHKFKPKQQPAAHAANSTSKSYGEASEELYVGRVHVFTGPMLINSKHGDDEFDGGWFTYTWVDPTEWSELDPSMSLEDVPHVSPDLFYSIDLKFRPSHHGEHGYHEERPHY